MLSSISTCNGIRDGRILKKGFETIRNYLQQYEIKLGDRLEIGSYCSIIERELKKQVESYLNKWSRFKNHQKI